MATVVFVATTLGASHGGINVFNAEILIALRAYDGLRTVCLVPSRDCIDPTLEAITEVVHLRSTGEGFGQPSDDAEAAISVLDKIGSINVVVGHDVVTGQLAIEIANRTGAKKVLVHHMAYGRYLSLMREGEAAAAKERDQHRLFPQADHCFAVGPLLLDSLHDIRRLYPEMPTPALMLPPLLDVAPASAPRTAPRILYSGRIESDNNVVKQAHLAARAVGRALKWPAGGPADASVDMYGFEPESPLIDKFRMLWATDRRRA